MLAALGGSAAVLFLSFVVLYFVPTYLVNLEWRQEQLTNEQSMNFTANLSETRSTFSKRLQRIFNVTTVSETELETLVQSFVNSTPYSNASTRSQFTYIQSDQLKWRYPNALFYVLSALLLTSYDNLECVTVQCEVVLLCVCTLGLVLSTLTLGAMVAVYHSILLRLLSSLFSLHSVPCRLSHQYLARVTLREVALLSVSLLLLIATWMMRLDQRDWSRNDAFVFVFSALTGCGHTQLVPDYIEDDNMTVWLCAVTAALLLWLTAFLALVFTSALRLLECIRSLRLAELQEANYREALAKEEQRRNPNIVLHPQYHM